ncbi:hypothetical protein B0H14DRAFT_2590060 [Mycena olivaceomarginata]|nr:hypothetical protein B0H14DRAFT_2590060 [Mycena olivaceomarginata]
MHYKQHRILLGIGSTARGGSRALKKRSDFGVTQACRVKNRPKPVAGKENPLQTWGAVGLLLASFPFPFEFTFAFAFAFAFEAEVGCAGGVPAVTPGGTQLITDRRAELGIVIICAPWVPREELTCGKGRGEEMMEEDVRRTGPKPRSKPLKPPKKKPAPKPTDDWQRGRNFQISEIRSQTGLAYLEWDMRRSQISEIHITWFNGGKQAPHVKGDGDPPSHVVLAWCSRHLASIARPNESAWWHFRSIIISEEAPIDGVGSESAIWNEVMVLQGRKQSAVGSGDRISETPQHNGTG